MAKKKKKLERREYAEGFKPLALAPDDVPYASKMMRLGAAAAKGSYKAACELKCMDCCAWDRKEVVKCEVRECPLWAINRKLFGGTT